MLTPIDYLHWNTEALKAWYPNFDKSLVKECYYVDSWSNYDCAGFLMVFKGIDDSYQVIMDEYSPFSDGDSEPMMIDVSEKQAKIYIAAFEKTIKDVESSDCYGV